MNVGENTEREKFYQRHIGIAIHHILGQHSDELANFIRSKWAIADITIRQTDGLQDNWPQLLWCGKWLDDVGGRDNKWFWEWQSTRPSSDHGIMRFYIRDESTVLLFKLACG
jgi:hypothetical protein